MTDGEWYFDISGVEETALLTLYTKAMESRSDDPILKDEVAEALVRKIDPYLKDKPSKMAKQLYQREIDPRLVSPSGATVEEVRFLCQGISGKTSRRDCRQFGVRFRHPLFPNR